MSKERAMKVKVSVVQESPEFFDRDKTVQKIEDIASRQARSGSRLVVFPESFVPGYPRGFTFGATIGGRTPAGRELYREYRENSFDLAGPELRRLEKLARTVKAYLAVGVTEKSGRHGSLSCSLVYISPQKGLLGVHRKIKPTGTERLVWSEAGGESLVTFKTAIGRLGGLICWENYMPLARLAIFRRGVEIFLAPTADSRDSWTATLRHIALEGRCFVLGCNQFFTKEMYPERFRRFVSEEPEVICRGGSAIVAPGGELLAGPLFDKAGVLEAELDLDDVVRSRLDFDVTGHYARDDIFELTVRNQPEIAEE
jgi:nitrilase